MSDELTITIPADRIPELVGWICDDGLRDEHSLRIRGEATVMGGLSPVEWAVLPALREHFSESDRVMVDELIAWSERSESDEAFGAAMGRLMEKVGPGRDHGWSVKYDGGDEWEVALWVTGDYAGTWRISADRDELLDPDEVELKLA